MINPRLLLNRCSGEICGFLKPNSSHGISSMLFPQNTMWFKTTRFKTSSEAKNNQSKTDTQTNIVTGCSHCNIFLLSLTGFGSTGPFGTDPFSSALFALSTGRTTGTPGTGSWWRWWWNLWLRIRPCLRPTDLAVMCILLRVWQCVEFHRRLEVHLSTHPTASTALV